MKYNKSEIMKNAWAIRRETGCTMSEAMKKAWAIAKAQKVEKTVETLTVEDLTALGGKLWEKSQTLRRVYFNRAELMSICNIEVDYYRSGNISNFVWDGETLSNSYGREIMDVIRGGVYYDLVNRKFVANGYDRYAKEKVVCRLTEYVLAA